ncbi:MAG TPA: septum formation initiator family protein [Candidatus Omnitrophota bacterium]|nr:septum formation initiator family protein [Candidatus Omnitrophota bacterium]HPN88637.1 septum formation initiator family protein [Candidatus Omnitrophota bacterium]
MKNAIQIFIAAAIILVVFLPSYGVMKKKEDRIKEYEEQIAILEKKNADLLKEKKRLEEDPVYLEGVARERMGLMREGEVIYRIKKEE